MNRTVNTDALGPGDISTWLDHLGIQHLLVLSPHLDDAVFSVATLLRAAAARSLVVTLFTDAEPGSSDAWTRNTGFASTDQEFAARRLEDARAMERLGCAHLHAGMRGGQLDERQARAWAHQLLVHSGFAADHTLVLLPAGAGGNKPYTAWQTLWNRLIRRPFGAPAHGDHRQVRDRFWKALSDGTCRLGFYAELPYIWKQGDLALQAELTKTFQTPLHRLTVRPDPNEKLVAASCYTSQMPLIFGQDTRYRLRALGRHETIFLAGKP
jgi:hypothetical protein